jgi:hypothetical protein
MSKTGVSLIFIYEEVPVLGDQLANVAKSAW